MVTQACSARSHSPAVSVADATMKVRGEMNETPPGRVQVFRTLWDNSILV